MKKNSLNLLLKEMGIDSRRLGLTQEMLKVDASDIHAAEFGLKCGAAFYRLFVWQSQDPSRCFEVNRAAGLFTVKLSTFRVQKIKPLVEKSEDLETAVKEAIKRFGGS